MPFNVKVKLSGGGPFAKWPQLYGGVANALFLGNP
jgi:hypothetical protein